MHILADRCETLLQNINSFLLFVLEGVFVTVPPDFQYQNEKCVTAEQGYFFKKFTT